MITFEQVRGIEEAVRLGCITKEEAIKVIRRELRLSNQSLQITLPENLPVVKG